jgi:hypothetical protein
MDQGLLLQVPQPPQMVMRPAAAKKSFIGKLAGSVAAHAYLSLAIIIVLLILVLGLVVYYRGFLFLGPYASSTRGHKPTRKRKESGDASGVAADEPPGDPETEKLIESINRH